MAQYRFYILGEKGTIEGSGLNADCIDDAAAIEFVQMFCRYGAHVEAWCGTRCLGWVSTPLSAMFWMARSKELSR